MKTYEIEKLPCWLIMGKVVVIQCDEFHVSCASLKGQKIKKKKLSIKI